MRGGRYQRDGQGIETRIVRCRGCGLVYPNPFPYPEDPEALYEEPVEVGYEHKIERGQGQIRELLPMCRADDPVLLDVGAGYGELVRAARDEGVRAEGIELSRAFVEQARRDYDVELLHGTIEDWDSPADIVVLNGVIEHVHDPDLLIRHTARVCNPGALVFIDTPREPNLLTMTGRLTRRTLNLSPTWPPYHVFGFNPRAIRALLRKHGFEIERLEVIDRRAVVPGSRVGTLVMRLANLTPFAANMSVWASRGLR
jgi:SAM-dependent methyltransferase